MSMLDWGIVAGLVVILIWAAQTTSRYTRSVADFLAANRCAGRYVLGVAEGIAGVGAISIVALFEAYYAGGFSFAWWALAVTLVTMVASMTGWIQYRYRETRALTLAQFLEQRYSRRFRAMAGMVAFVSGTINFGIFPAVGARFFIRFCALPMYSVPLGPLELDITMAIVMSVLIGLALLFTFMGGQIAVIVTDFIQGTVFNILLCLTVMVLLWKVPWPTLIEGILMRPEGQSMIHPFHSTKTADFNLWYYLIQSFGIFYCFMAWQGNQGYYCSARNAHEARLGRVMGSWRDMTQRSLIIMIPICAYTILHHPDWASTAAEINSELAGIANETLRTQLTTSVTLKHVLPTGAMGAFAAVMLAAFISTHDTYLHAWGGIFIQDVLVPLRKRPIGQDEHMKLLRRSIVGVALFVFLFSLFFPQNSSVLMYFARTGTIWLGGAGAVIAGGLYWKHGTTGGAYGALITGMVMALLGFFAPIYWKAHHTTPFPVNPQWTWLIAMMTSTVVYVLVSLTGKRVTCNMEKLLRRGSYAVADDHEEDTVSDESVGPIRRLLGMGSEFSLGDRVVYLAILGWSVVWGLIFIIGTLYNIVRDVPDMAWARFWHIYVWIHMVLGVVTTIWFAFGGCMDLKHMFRRLGTIKRDAADDGAVTEHLLD